MKERGGWEEKFGGLPSSFFLIVPRTIDRHWQKEREREGEDTLPSAAPFPPFLWRRFSFFRCGKVVSSEHFHPFLFSFSVKLFLFSYHRPQ